MSLEVLFNQAINEWKTYTTEGTLPSGKPVPLSSLAKHYRECPAYTKIVAMGPAALPLIRKLYDADTTTDPTLADVQDFGLHAVVQGIVGWNFSIPKHLRGNHALTRDFTRSWLDRNMRRYATRP